MQDFSIYAMRNVYISGAAFVFFCLGDLDEMGIVFVRVWGVLECTISNIDYCL